MHRFGLYERATRVIQKQQGLDSIVVSSIVGTLIGLHVIETLFTIHYC